MWAGQLTLRPEVEAAMPVLEAQGYAAVPSWRQDGRWELWTQEGNITSGPSETSLRTRKLRQRDVFGAMPFSHQIHLYPVGDPS